MTSRSGAPLLGQIFDDRDNPMSPSETLKGKVRYRYYVSTALLSGRKAEAGSVSRVPAHAVEASVQHALEEHDLANAADPAVLAPDLIARLDLRVMIEQRAIRISWADQAAAHKGSSFAHDDDDAEDQASADRRCTMTIVRDWTGRKRERAIHLPGYDMAPTLPRAAQGAAKPHLLDRSGAEQAARDHGRHEHRDDRLARGQE